jgi:CHAT domain-containing protein
MGNVYDIRLEFLRPGPAHNQLLSPLTPYIALCGADAPMSVNLPFEHAQLLNRLSRLRYKIDGAEVAAPQRQAEVQELGETIARVLGKIPGLIAELRATHASISELVNIRLVISAYELGLVPFELTMYPGDTSGSNNPLLLRSLTNMTREIRRGQPLNVEWNRPPKILFVFASPPGFAVPARQHLEALRRALDPWISIKETPEERVAEVREKLTVLKDATASKISEACQADDYTHVHILAHGAPIPGSENRRFGVVLNKETDPSGHVVVDGQSIAMALKGLTVNGHAKQPPTVVTLATCDSGNTGSVLTPGASIAHELHAQDIPWVVASQFPLGMRASNIAAEVLYRNLLAGEDPRWTLHELRQRVRIAVPDTHDWASLVAYAAIAPDLESQVAAFRGRQTKKKIEVKFARMDDLVGANQLPKDKRVMRDVAKVAPELEKLCLAIRADLAKWCNEPAAQRDPKEKADRLGISAASEKRVAIVYMLFNGAGYTEAYQKSIEAYRKSHQLYEAALKIEPANHWIMTQFLSISATPALAATEDAVGALGPKYEYWWLVARQLAEWRLDSAATTERAWAHGTLAELELLGAIYGGSTFSHDKAEIEIISHCKKICELSAEDRFPVFSTQRQFRRYIVHWPRVQWERLAEAALEVLDRDKVSVVGASKQGPQMRDVSAREDTAEQGMTEARQNSAGSGEAPQVR